MSEGDHSRCRIRPIESADVADLIRIGEETNLSPWSAQNYVDEMKNPAAIMLRLEGPDNETIGFIVGRTVAGGVTDTVDAEIYNIAITPTEQRKGSGQLMFDAFTMLCGDKLVKNIWLEVRASNRSAISFYERNGFEIVQTRNHFYENPREHGRLMRLELK